MNTNTVPNEITNSEDIIDSRDIIERIEYLEGFLVDEEDRDADTEYVKLDDETFELEFSEVEELRQLRELQSEGSDYSPDWKYGSTLIRDSYFEDYAQELAEDIGAINRESSWPNNCIDWEQAAQELQMDYTAVDFDGVTYWVR